MILNIYNVSIYDDKMVIINWGNNGRTFGNVIGPSGSEETDPAAMVSQRSTRPTHQIQN